MVDLLKDDIVSVAEENIKSLSGNLLTTTQIRKLMSGVVELKNMVELNFSQAISGGKLNVAKEPLPADIVDAIRYFRVMVVYQAGRDSKVKEFVDKTEIDKLIGTIGSNRNAFKKFVQYFEALVAFHKYEDAKRNGDSNKKGGEQ